MKNKNYFGCLGMIGLTMLGQSAAYAATPCGPIQILESVGQSMNPPLQNAKDVYNSIFFPTQYPNGDAVSPTSTFGLRGCKGPIPNTSTPVPIPNTNPVQYFPDCQTYFSYDNFATAWINATMASDPKIATAAKSFSCVGTLTERKSELASFFANIAQETTGANPVPPNPYANPWAGVAWGFSFYSEGSFYPNGASGDGTIGMGQYYGRGPKQLTYLSNYQWASSVIFKNTTTLVNNPNLISQNPLVGWYTALAYQSINRVTPNGNLLPTMQQAEIKSMWDPLAYPPARGPWGFGQTINVINGGVECSPPNLPYLTRLKQIGRINNYIELMVRFGVDVQQVYINNMGNISLVDKAELYNNIYGRNDVKWGDRMWNTAPLPQDEFNVDPIPSGQYYLEYNDYEKPMIPDFNVDPMGVANVAERLDCWGNSSSY